MEIINKNQFNILKVLLEKNDQQSSEIHKMVEAMGSIVSLVTIKRELTEMLSKGLVTQTGGGRYVYYSISVKGRVLYDIDVDSFSLLEPDKRSGFNKYNFELFKDFPLDVLNNDELNELDKATEIYRKSVKDQNALLIKKELERFIIELSWKSSKIEGNTYSLLDTEKLIRENERAKGHSLEEAKMILNHKKAFLEIFNNRDKYLVLTKGKVDNIHSILVHDLGVSKGFRDGSVGITGSKYTPLDNKHQINDAVEALLELVNRCTDPYAKALIVLTGIGYIQPFEDGNKRTARLITNAVLLAHELAPLSYRSIGEDVYRSGMLVFYELNSIIPMKRIFIEQYIAAAQNYALD